MLKYAHLMVPMDYSKSDLGVRRFISYLESHGVQPTLIEPPNATHSASAAAQALGCDLSQIVKSLLFLGCQTGRAVLVLVSGANQANSQRLSEIIGEKVRLADPKTVLSLTGYPVGAVPPTGLNTILPTIIDEDLSTHKDVWISGGSDHALAKITFRELCELTGGKVTIINRKLAIPVVIVPYDPKWPDQFVLERDRIKAAVGQYLRAIEHIGSTAVPGLPAKPIIDILGGAFSLGDAPLFIPALEKSGYHYIPEYEAQLPERRYLTRSENGHVVVHLHIVETTTLFWRNHITFRDRLISDDQLRDDYGRLKIELAGNFNDDRVGYTDAKSDFIQGVLNRDNPDTDKHQPIA